MSIIPISKPIVGEAEKTAIMEVLDSGMLAQGPRVAEFEKCFAALCDVPHAIATCNGTASLHIALLANGVGPGDEVITTPFTFIASVNSILFVGARPVFCDVDPETFNLDVDKIESKITPRTRALMPVHLYGYPCNMDAITSIADRHSLCIIEDAAQAVGATHHGRPVGSFGTGCFSLYATKNIQCGEGGMITTSDDRVAHLARLIRNHGMERRYYHDLLGYNLRLSDLHAAIGLAQMDKLDALTSKRRSNAAYLNGNLQTVITPKVKDGYEHVWHQYTIRLDGGRDRDLAVLQLNKAGIGTGIFYPVPAHYQAHVRNVIGEIDLPNAERLAGEVVSLPVHPALSQDDLDSIVREVNRL